MVEIADFDKPWTEMEKVPCACGHARVFHEPRCCGMAGCNKCKGFTPRPPIVPAIAQFGALLPPRIAICSCGQSVADCRGMLKEGMAGKRNARLAERTLQG